MSLIKSINRVKRINDLIEKEVTGPAEDFAKKIGISRSMLMENLREMKEMGAEFYYCPHKRSYVYSNKFSLIIGPHSKSRIKGGLNQIRLTLS